MRGCLINPVRKLGYTFFLLATAYAFASPGFAANPLTDFGVETPKTRLVAPDFTLPTLDGGSITLSDYQGKLVFINFWATWCIPCRDEMPSMQTLWERYKDQDFVILGVAADHNTKQVAEFVEEFDLSFPILLDTDGKVRNTYEVVGLPMTYFIGQDGKISGRLLSAYDWSEPDSVAIIEHLLQR